MVVNEIIYKSSENPNKNIEKSLTSFKNLKIFYNYLQLAWCNVQLGGVHVLFFF